MNQWNHHTLFRLLVGFTSGILAYSLWPGSGNIPFILFLVGMILVVVTRRLIKKYALYRNRYVVGIIITLVMTGFGYEWSRLSNQRNNPIHFSHYYLGQVPVIAEIVLPIENKPNSYKIVAKIIAVEKDSTWVRTTGKALLYFPKDSLSVSLRYGDRLAIYSTLAPPPLPVNPGEFNYRRFLSNKNIHYQSFVRNGDWAIVGSGYGNRLMQFSIILRDRFISIFEKNKIIGQEFAVVNALVLGYDDYLDNETRKEFSSAGAMHVLCVSGLHVGIIFLVLNTMLVFLKRNRYTRLLKSLLMLMGIWLYALITGLSPSVLRAATMFSFVIVGSAINRQGHIYNSLSASAFLLLLINPFMLHNVGFQLSYAAVLAIVSLQPILYNLWIPENKIVDKAWGLVTVSVAAQAGTFPLGLYYFHQFPNYFILTNLVAIPLATLILYAGFLVVLTSFVPLVSYWIAQGLVLLLKLLNGSVSFIDKLPYSASSGLFISIATVLMLYFLILSVTKGLVARKSLFIKLALLTAILILAEGLFREMRWQKQQKMVIYSVKNDAAIDLMHGRNSLLITSDTIIKYPGLIAFNIAGNRVQSGNKSTVVLCIDSINFPNTINSTLFPLAAHDPFFLIGDKLFLLVRNDFPFNHLPDTLRVDYAIIYSDKRFMPDNALEKIKASQVIITNKVPLRSVEYWRRVSQTNNIPYHLIREEGAFVFRSER